MFMLRRSALKALSAPTASHFVKSSRSFTSATPAILRLQRQWISPLQHRRLYSDEKTEQVGTSDAAITTEETGPESTSQPEIEQAEESSSVEPPPVTESSSVESSPFAETPKDAGSTQERIPTDPDRSIYVGNLYFEVTEAQLRTVFSPFGELDSVRLVCDNRGLSRGFAFVTFKNKADTEEACASLHQQVFEGRRMVVQVHTPRTRSDDASTPIAKHPPTKTLFVGNMSFEMSDKDLNDLFREIRNVLDVRVAIDRRTGQPRGFAHADFVDIESAQKAKEILDGRSFYGRKLRIDFSGSSKIGRGRNPQ